uniref:Uncharacterized protein n=1 Tax=Anguilla anguilla TaxID=7936 RepID=A0A0E9Y254_ANGAN
MSPYRVIALSSWLEEDHTKSTMHVFFKVNGVKSLTSDPSKRTGASKGHFRSLVPWMEWVP